jgi:hypothetical protein
VVEFGDALAPVEYLFSKLWYDDTRPVSGSTREKVVKMVPRVAGVAGLSDAT